MSNVHDAIISWCRDDNKRKRGIARHPVMRIPYHVPGTPDQYFVFDLHTMVPKPGGMSWEQTEKTIANGASWDECLVTLRELDPQYFDKYFATHQ